MRFPVLLKMPALVFYLLVPPSGPLTAATDSLSGAGLRILVK